MDTLNTFFLCVCVCVLATSNYQKTNKSSNIKSIAETLHSSSWEIMGLFLFFTNNVTDGISIEFAQLKGCFNKHLVSKSALERAGVAFYLLFIYLSHDSQPETGDTLYNIAKEKRRHRDLKLKNLYLEYNTNYLFPFHRMEMLIL